MIERNRNEVPDARRIREEHRALAILRALQRLPCFSCNDSLIADILGLLALSGTAPEIREVVNGLERLGLVIIERTDPLLVFRLTQKGDETAKGLILVEGVLRPPPECPY